MTTTIRLTPQQRHGLKRLMQAEAGNLSDVALALHGQVRSSLSRKGLTVFEDMPIEIDGKWFNGGRFVLTDDALVLGRKLFGDEIADQAQATKDAIKADQAARKHAARLEQARAAMRQVGAELDGKELPGDDELREAEAHGLTVTQLRANKTLASLTHTIKDGQTRRVTDPRTQPWPKLKFGDPQPAFPEPTPDTLTHEGYDFVRGGVSRMYADGTIINSQDARDKANVPAPTPDTRVFSNLTMGQAIGMHCVYCGTAEVSDSYRRSIRLYYGKPGLATRAEVVQWLRSYGESENENLAHALSQEEDE